MRRKVLAAVAVLATIGALWSDAHITARIFRCLTETYCGPNIASGWIYLAMLGVVYLVFEAVIFVLRKAGLLKATKPAVQTLFFMPANVNKIAVIALLIAAVSLSGCGSKDAPLKLGDNFPVCINAQERIVVRGSSDGHDFDVVHLAVDGVLVDAVVGWHPPFSNDRIKNGIGAKDAFVYLGKERSGDKDRILWRYDRGEVSGPVFVVFSGHDLESIEPVLTAEKLLVSCNVEAWEKARSRDVRPTAS